jgi:hypothetical protein
LALFQKSDAWIWLLRQHGYNIAQIAAITGKKHNTISRAYQRCQERLFEITGENPRNAPYVWIMGGTYDETRNANHYSARPGVTRLGGRKRDNES